MRQTHLENYTSYDLIAHSDLANVPTPPLITKLVTLHAQLDKHSPILFNPGQSHLHTRVRRAGAICIEVMATRAQMLAHARGYRAVQHDAAGADVAAIEAYRRVASLQRAGRDLDLAVGGAAIAVDVVPVVALLAVVRTQNPIAAHLTAVFLVDVVDSVCAGEGGHLVYDRTRDLGEGLQRG